MLLHDESDARWVVRDNGRFTDLDAHGEPNQYALSVDGERLSLRLVARDERIAEPRIMDVNTLTGYALLPAPDIGPDVPGGGAV